jgi:hypothetical protein
VFSRVLAIYWQYGNKRSHRLYFRNPIREAVSQALIKFHSPRSYPKIYVPRGDFYKALFGSLRDGYCLLSVSVLAEMVVRFGCMHRLKIGF